jgi:Ser/Thr protein kinase RdoA (MazF antagonist)
VPFFLQNISPDYVADTYGFEVETTCSILRTGINYSYLIATKERKFVFRVYSKDWRTENEITAELGLLNYLRERGISVSFSITDTAEKEI